MPSNQTNCQIFNHQKVLILGFGLEGQASLRYLKKFASPQQISVADQNPKISHLKSKYSSINNWHLGESYLASISQYDIIIRSPGISANTSELIKAKSQGTKLTSHTQLFLNLYHSQIIGVTGTAGKSTTVALIQHLLKATRQNTVLVGNIGQPPLDSIDQINLDTIIITELSSHQLMDVNLSPHIALILDIFPDHLDYYATFEDYVEAKAHICLHQNKSDVTIYNPHNQPAASLANKTPATKITIGTSSNSDNSAVLKDNKIILNWSGQAKAFNLPQPFPLIGKHNIQNLMFALAAISPYDIPNDQIESSISSFKPLPHRLQTVLSVNQITYVNDSISTTPQSTIAALEALPHQVDTLILGGQNRHQSYATLIDVIKKYQVRNLILFPDTGPMIKQQLPGNIKVSIFETDAMDQAVFWSEKHTQKGKICLLSPAAPSFNLYRDFKDRGDQFINAVKQL